VTAGADPLARARYELAAADHLASGGFAAQAISRAYYAAFYAAARRSTRRRFPS
jgi:uncharacterized protein (UPF0332 family)